MMAGVLKGGVAMAGKQKGCFDPGESVEVVNATRPVAMAGKQKGCFDKLESQ